jgi:ADP-ribose pyrophosphatase YjhB (NUDIX family)
MKNHSEKYDSARPYIACFIILQKGNKIAMVLRKNTGWMDGYYGLPAGKVEYGEPYAVGAIREAKEEAGVDIKLADISFAHIAHRHEEDDKEFMDWVDVYFRADRWTGEPYNVEEDKSERLDWLDLSNLPENIVPPQRFALLNINKGVNYSEFGW